MPLTDIRIRQAKADRKPIKIADAHGLYLEVRPSGAKLWRYRYRIANRENVFALGSYPDISLQEARRLRDDARDLVRAGRHPAHARLEQKTATIDASRQTFESVALEWLGKKKAQWSETHFDQIKRMLEMYVFPHIGKLPIRSVTASQVLDILRRIEEAGAPSVASKARTYISSIYQYAVITQRADNDPASVLRGAVISPPVENARPLSQDELTALFRQLAGYTRRHPRTGRAIRLLMILFTRTIELCRARWDEIDLDAGEWRIPPEKIKSRRLHIVPLPQQAKELLLELREMTGGFGYVFPIQHSNRKRPHMSRTTINRAIENMVPAAAEPITGHDFRATASTYLHEMGYDSAVVEMQLSHKDKDKTRATYNHAKYLAERREMMQEWANWLEGIERTALADGDAQRAA